MTSITVSKREVPPPSALHTFVAELNHTLDALEEDEVAMVALDELPAPVPEVIAALRDRRVVVLISMGGRLVYALTPTHLCFFYARSWEEGVAL